MPRGQDSPETYLRLHTVSSRTVSYGTETSPQTLRLQRISYHSGHEPTPPQWGGRMPRIRRRRRPAASQPCRRSKAREMAIAGDPITAEDAAEIGLVAGWRSTAAPWPAMLLSQRVAKDARSPSRPRQPAGRRRYWGHQRSRRPVWQECSRTRSGRAFCDILVVIHLHRGPRRCAPQCDTLGT